MTQKMKFLIVLSSVGISSCTKFAFYFPIDYNIKADIPIGPSRTGDCVSDDQCEYALPNKGFICYKAKSYVGVCIDPKLF